MTVGSLISEVRGPVSSLIETHRNELRDRRVYQALISARSYLIDRELKRSSEIGVENYSYIDCLDLVSASMEECAGTPCPSKRMLRTKEKFPETLGEGSNQFSSVTGLNGSLRFSYVDWQDMADVSSRRFSQHLPKFFHWNGYLYFFNCNPLLKVVRAVYLAQDPVGVEGLSIPCGETAQDQEFPIAGNLKGMLIQRARYELGIMGETGKGGDVQGLPTPLQPTPQ